MVSVVASTPLSTNVSRPVAGFAVGVLRRGGDHQVLRRHVALDGGQMHGRHREGDIDRLHLRDRHQFRRVRRDQIAGLDGEVAGAAVERRIE